MRRHAHTVQRPGLERLVAIIAAFGAMMSLMVVVAPAAFAHHPNLTGSVACDGADAQVSYQSFTWTNTNDGGRYNSNIGVYVDLTSGTTFSGSVVKVASGKFLPSAYPVSGVSYVTPEYTAQQTQSPAGQFSGTFDASAWEGQTIYLKARADAKWWNNTAAGSIGEANDVIRIAVPVCTEGVAVTPNPQVCEVDDGVATGSVSFDIAPSSGATVRVYANSNFTGPIGGALGDDESLNLPPGTYYWQATASSGDYTVSAPASGQFTIQPCHASTVVVSGECAVNPNGAPVGAVTVTITPPDGATVTVRDASNQIVGSVSGSGGNLDLPPGAYSWLATPGSGVVIDGQSSGSFTVQPCTSTVVVTHGNCVVGQGGPAGSVTVVIDPNSGAIVTVSGPGGPYQFSNTGGTQTLAPGVYSWLAAPGSGFVLDGDASGEFTVLPCDVHVTVQGSCVLDGNAGNGLLSIDISDAGGAEVAIYDGADLVTTLTSSGSVSVPEGHTYTWKASSSDGFALTGATEGSVNVDDCTRSISIDVAGVCRGDIPYLTWTVTPVNFDATQTTITWLDIDPSDPLYSSVQPLSGEMLWPGVVVQDGKVVDWPGWIQVDGLWVNGSDGYENTRPMAGIRFDVNPSAEVHLAYPGGDPTCDGPAPHLDVKTNSFCKDDSPYLHYESVVSGNFVGDESVTIHWFDKNGVERDPADSQQLYSGLAPSGDVLWPGARAKGSEATDWPGWTFVADAGSSTQPMKDSTGSVVDPNGASGKWQSGDDGFLWSKQAGAYVTIQVNPTTDPILVSYPGGSPTCSTGPDEVLAEVIDPDELPFTGMDAGILFGASVVMLGLGLGLVLYARRREEG